MTTKFIELTLKNEKDKELVSPTFITRIRRVGTQTIVYTMDGNSIYTEDSVEDVIKKIKDSEKFILHDKSSDNKPIYY